MFKVEIIIDKQDLVSSTTVDQIKKLLGLQYRVKPDDVRVRFDNFQKGRLALPCELMLMILVGKDVQWTRPDPALLLLKFSKITLDVSGRPLQDYHFGLSIDGGVPVYHRQPETTARK